MVDSIAFTCCVNFSARKNQKIWAKQGVVMIDSRVNTYCVNFSARKRAKNLGKIESSHDYDVSTLDSITWKLRG